MLLQVACQHLLREENRTPGVALGDKEDGDGGNLVGDQRKRRRRRRRKELPPLVEARREGQAIFYSIRDPKVTAAIKCLAALYGVAETSAD